MPGTLADDGHPEGVPVEDSVVAEKPGVHAALAVVVDEEHDGSGVPLVSVGVPTGLRGAFPGGGEGVLIAALLLVAVWLSRGAVPATGDPPVVGLHLRVARTVQRPSVRP